MFNHDAAMASVIINNNNEANKKDDANKTKELPGIYADMTIGSTGTSVGTHLALEAIFFKEIKEKFDPERKIQPVKINEYKYHIWNIYTIVRNLLQAIQHKNKAEVLMDKHFAKVLAREVENIASMYMFDTECQPLLFFPNYGMIYKGMNKNKKDGFTKVYEEHMMVKDILTKFKSSGMLKSTNDGKGYRLPKLEGKVLLTSNLAVDLCNTTPVDLLESHTGVVKKKYEWGTKYHSLGENKLGNIPFLERLLYILGDKTIIKPMNIIIRRDIVNLASTCEWTGRTTKEKVNYDINKKGTPLLRDTYNGYNSFY